MQYISTIILACALSSVALSAPVEAPWATTATIQLANDQSGRNANVSVPIDGVYRPVQELWGNTAVAQNGLVFASSAQLTAFDKTTVCRIIQEPFIDVNLDAQRTWASATGGVVDLCAAYIVCECEIIRSTSSLYW